ncbi:hypothetical protein N9954_06620 [Maribacter sp.]|nr:hypothetical protein [Maribacter sp.]
MRSIATVLLVCIMGCFAACNGKTKQPNTDTKQLVSSKKDTSLKQMNLLDEQTKMFGHIFTIAGTGEDNPLGNATDYQDLIKKMEMPEAQKEMLLEQYKVYDLSLDPSKEDSLKIMVNKMLTKVMQKSQNEH